MWTGGGLSLRGMVLANTRRLMMKLSERITQRSFFVDGLFRIEVEGWANEVDKLEAENEVLRGAIRTRDDCEHLQIETLYQYDRQKNRTVFWGCPKCLMQFQPKGLVDAQLEAEIEALKKENDIFFEILKPLGKKLMVESGEYEAILQDTQ